MTLPLGRVSPLRVVPRAPASLHRAGARTRALPWVTGNLGSSLATRSRTPPEDATGFSIRSTVATNAISARSTYW